MKSFAFLLLFFVTLTHGAAAPVEPGADIFATNAPVARIRVDIPAEGIRSLERNARVAVRATVREGNTVYSNVAVHVKGAMGSFRNIHDGPSLTLSFGKFQANQRFHGLRKIHLNNSLQDRSYTSYNITSRMFNDAGVPAARVSNARFVLNGKDQGFYVLVEGFEKEFLQRYFKDTSGNLYDGGFLTDITDNIEKDAGDDRKDSPDLKALAAACEIPDRALRWAAMQKRLDVDRFLSYMAIETLTWDWDGYMMQMNNYRVYHDPTTDKMVFMPHGMDQMFSQPEASIYRPIVGGLVARSLMETPEGAKRFRERTKEVFEKHFPLEVMTNRFDFLVKRNREAVAELGQGALRELDQSTGWMRSQIIARWKSVKEQIENEPKPLDFSKPVNITRWRQQNQSGGAHMDEAEADGKPALHIRVNNPAAASWRSSVLLEQGRYRFEGLARCARLAGTRDQRGEGAGLRISGSERRNKITGDMQWTKLQFDFEVFEPSRPVELICESIASRGEVWFDTSSLKLIKLK